ncbi:MAG: hypothetical protein JWR26_4421 [Pedosphaera sp.]|nr:hypothetical protein [Pedosphaera sp.]
MKNLGLVLVLLLSSASGLFAQVAAEVLMDKTQFLPGEAITVSTRVVNHSGQTLHFGKENWLSYSVEGNDGFIPVKTGDPDVAHEFDLESAQAAKQPSDLAPYFTLSKPGTYTVIATVRLEGWGAEVTSPPKRFTIIRGTKVWEQGFGVPQAGTMTPEMRKYILIQATYLKSMKLYLRLTDSTESRTIRLVPIGPMVSFSRLQTQLDKQNNLHLLYEDGPRTSNYSVISPDGEITVRQTHMYTDGGPRLKMDASGDIAVVGGARHLAANDLPAIKPPVLSDDIPPPKP